MHLLKVGPAPIPIDSLTAERLADGLRVLQQPEVAAAAAAVAERIGQVGGRAAVVCSLLVLALALAAAAAAAARYLPTIASLLVGDHRAAP